MTVQEDRMKILIGLTMALMKVKAAIAVDVADMPAVIQWVDMPQKDLNLLQNFVN